ncbi:MAG: hypothetical protein ACRC35_00965 [Angustibacter sp.]
MTDWIAVAIAGVALIVAIPSAVYTKRQSNEAKRSRQTTDAMRREEFLKDIDVFVSAEPWGPLGSSSWTTAQPARCWALR